MSEPDATTVSVHGPGSLADLGRACRTLLERHGHESMYCDPATVAAIAGGLGQDPYVIAARSSGEISGVLLLIHMHSLLFGSFLVSLPYVSWAGVVAESPECAHRLVRRAVELAEELDANYLELRQPQGPTLPGLVEGTTEKVQMRVPLSSDADHNWRLLKQEVRTQIRKATKSDLKVGWGGRELLESFYDVFARNMRDLGTPVFPKALFANLLSAKGRDAEIGVVRLDGKPIAACLAVHGPGLTEIPSAAALREFRKTAANSLMYWQAIERAIARGQSVFDFGRSTPASATFEFKRKWGAAPTPVTWLYHLRRGDTQGMRPDNRKYQLARRLWQHLPVSASRVLGPMIVRGIP